MKDKRPPFIWDYDISEEKTRKILKGPECSEKDWLIVRILEHASWKTIWEYLDLAIIKEHLEHLRLKPWLKSHWRYALKRWS